MVIIGPSPTACSRERQRTSAPTPIATSLRTGSITWFRPICKFPDGFAQGFCGRVNGVSGANYAAVIRPGGGVLDLVKFRAWGDWDVGNPMASTSVSVDTSWHTLKLAFRGNRIGVYLDGAQVLNAVDNNFDSRAPYFSGGIAA